MKQKTDYGLDAPIVIRNLTIIGILCLATSIIGYYFFNINLSTLKLLVGILFFVGVCLIVIAIIMILSSMVGKIKERERILDILSIKGHEYILDVGCGRGLYLIGAAKRLSNGKAVGIDIWQNEDLSGNKVENTLKNANAEGVIDKIQIKTSDMRNMPFENSSFDIILSCFAIHNIHDGLERKKALREIARILKPGAKLCIIDIQHIDEYIKVFKENGITDINKFKTKLVFPAANVIIGVKDPVPIPNKSLL